MKKYLSLISITIVALALTLGTRTSAQAEPATSANYRELNQHLTEIADQQIKRILGSSPAWVSIDLKMTRKSGEEFNIRLPLSQTRISSDQIYASESSSDRWTRLLPEISKLNVLVMVPESMGDPVRKILQEELQKTFTFVGSKIASVEILNAPPMLSGLWSEQNRPVIQSGGFSELNSATLIGVAMSLFLGIASFLGILFGMKKMQMAIKEVATKQESAGPTNPAAPFNPNSFNPAGFAPSQAMNPVSPTPKLEPESEDRFWKRVQAELLVRFTFDFLHDPNHIGGLRVLFEDSFESDQISKIEDAIGEDLMTEILDEPEPRDRRAMHDSMMKKFRSFQPEYRRLNKNRIALLIERAPFEVLKDVVSHLDQKTAAIVIHSVAPQRKDRILATLKLDERIKLSEATKRIDKDQDMGEIEAKVQKQLTESLRHASGNTLVPLFGKAEDLDLELLKPHSFAEDTALAGSHLQLSFIGRLLLVPNAAWNNVPLQDLAGACFGYDEKTLKSILGNLDETRKKWFESYVQARKDAKEDFETNATTHSRSIMTQWIDHQATYAEKAAA